MTELEKANKTIQELMKINEELGGYNNNVEKARQRIIELEKDLERSEKLILKYQRKLISRKAIIKEVISEILVEILKPLMEEE